MFLAMCAVTTYLVAVLAGELTTGSKLEAELRAQALRDSLTGLANRRLLFDRIEQASRRLARQPGTFALLFIDLDAFKAINDSYGHAAGDLVLAQSADRLRDVVRDHDSIARIGGDEFLILAEDLARRRRTRTSSPRASCACSTSRSTRRPGRSTSARASGSRRRPSRSAIRRPTSRAPIARCTSSSAPAATASRPPDRLSGAARRPGRASRSGNANA